MGMEMKWRFAGRRDACPTIFASHGAKSVVPGHMSGNHSGAGVPPARKVPQDPLHFPAVHSCEV
jgi:hypothetical protein